MSLVLHRSNRIEELSRELARLLASPCLPETFNAEELLRPETIVVNSMGMQRWLSMELATHLNISSNIRFPFPTRTIQELLHEFVGQTQDNELHRWLPQSVAWKILDALDGNLDSPAFAPLKEYLAIDTATEAPITRNHYILARRIADVFDKYLTYRPEMILEWERFPEQFTNDWQPLLWNQLNSDDTPPHIAQLATEFLNLDSKACIDLSKLPPRLFLFGLSTLPPLWVDILNQLSNFIPVHLFLLCPSREYWGHISSRREIASALRQKDNPDLIASDLYLEEGNALLSSLGRVGRDFQCILEGQSALESYQESDRDLFAAPDAGAPTLLTLLQRDILDLRSPAKTAATEDDSSSEALPAHRVSPHDRSVEIHACHGPLRQVEVLRDRILNLLNNDPTLFPRDIIVLSTDIEKYAPLIHAVFSEGDTLVGGTAAPDGVNGFPRLPFSIADRSLEKLNPVAESLMSIIEIAKTRVTASGVLHLLNHGPIRTKFEIKFEDIPKIRQWVAQTAIHWGIDGAHKDTHGHPPSGGGTFEFGLDRMILGYVFDDESLFGGVLCTDSVGENDASLLGQLTHFCSTLFETITHLQTPKKCSQWVQTFRQILHDLTHTEASDEWLTHQILQIIEAFSQSTSHANDQQLLELDAIEAALSEHLQSPPEFTTFLGGGITCCAMIPMRSIPFRVVCFLGMDDNEFPRQPNQIGFDKAAANPRIGDRNSRDDDRYLFLESLLSARENVLICYTGRGIHDNKPYPPAVPVGELLDYIERSFIHSNAPEDSIAEHLVFSHPLQGFSPQAFKLQPSFSRPYYRGALQLMGPKEAAPLFLDSPVQAIPAHDDNGISLRSIERFFSNPSAAFLQHSLQLSYRDDTIELSDDTRVALQGLDGWKIGNQLCEISQTGLPESHLRDYVEGTGQIPVGTLGDVALHPILEKTERLAQAATPLMSTEASWVDLRLNSPKIPSVFGRVNNLFGTKRVVLQYATIKGHHLLNAWLSHIAMHAKPQNFSETILIGPQDNTEKAATVFRLKPLDSDPRIAAEKAHLFLTDLVEVYQWGLRYPLPLFKSSSYAYAQKVHSKPDCPKAEASARKSAQSAWFKHNYHLDRDEGDATDPAVSILYGNDHPHEPGYSHPAHPSTEEYQFDTLALRIFSPLLNHLEMEALT